MSGEKLGLIALAENADDISLLYNLSFFYSCLDKIRDPDVSISFLPDEDKAREKLDSIISEISNDSLKEAAILERQSVEEMINEDPKDSYLMVYLVVMLDRLNKYTSDWFQQVTIERLDKNIDLALIKKEKINH